VRLLGGSSCTYTYESVAGAAPHGTARTLRLVFSGASGLLCPSESRRISAAMCSIRLRRKTHGCCCRCCCWTGVRWRRRRSRIIFTENAERRDVATQFVSGRMNGCCRGTISAADQLFAKRPPPPDVNTTSLSPPPPLNRAA